jgi:Ca-activated chloride channel family protein
MSFIWPAMLFLLILIPPVVLLYIKVQRHRRQLMAEYGHFGLWQEALSQKPGTRSNIPPVLFLLSLTILIFASARPQAIVSLPRVEGTIILSFDVSGSMAASDIEPTRMEAAKSAARDFIQNQPSSVQIGVVAFSDSGFSVQPPTNDQAAILGAIKRLTPQRGTSLGQGIFASLTAINQDTSPTTRYYSNITPEPTSTPTPVPQGTYTPAVIILLTDGENNENPDPLAAAQEAVNRGVRIFTVGIGSTAGTTLDINGFTVHTQLDEATLQQISQITGGEYYSAVNAQDLISIYQNLDPHLVIKPQKMEITSIFAGASLLILLIGGFLSALWFNRFP